jgi:hypothetical protein
VKLLCFKENTGVNQAQQRTVKHAHCDDVKLFLSGNISDIFLLGRVKRKTKNTVKREQGKKYIDC